MILVSVIGLLLWSAFICGISFLGGVIFTIKMSDKPDKERKKQ